MQLVHGSLPFSLDSQWQNHKCFIDTLVDYFFIPSGDNTQHMACDCLLYTRMPYTNAQPVKFLAAAQTAGDIPQPFVSGKPRLPS